MSGWYGLPRDGEHICGAYARSTGKPCRQYGNKRNGRCRLHGGNSTGPKNPHRPIKHGQRTKEAEARNREAAELIKQVKDLMQEMEP
jgi:hypothetical protein